MIRSSIGTLLAVLFAVVALTAQDPAAESTYYTVEHLKTPDGARLEVGGIDFLPDGRLVAGTRRGQVWIIDAPESASFADAKAHLYCEGLQEILGVSVDGTDVYVLQRSELSRLRDADGDGTAECIDTISNGWGVSGNYHEFAFGLPRDDAGNFWITLNVAFFSPKWWHGKSPVRDRGWVLKISPDGRIERIAAGLRSPCGIGRNAAGDIFVTDNQGDWVPTSSVAQVVPGRFYGHPAGLDWTKDYESAGQKVNDTDPPNVKRAPVALWIPYEWSRSTGNLIEDTSGGKFGPFAGQYFLAEMTNGVVLRASLEKVRGEYQGVVFPFRKATGSAIRVALSPSGSLFCGLSNRGWGGQAPDDGISRLRFLGKTPMEMRDVKVITSGFEIEFTLPLDADCTPTPADFALRQYDYDWWWEYGSPERHDRMVPIDTVALSPDRTKATLKIGGLRAGMMARCKVSNIRGGGLPLLHDEFAYTLNQFPDGPLCHELIAKVVPPPPPRETGDEGWLFLNRGDALDGWKGAGWKAGNFGLDEAKSTLIEKPFDPEGDREPPADPNREARRPEFIANLGDGATTTLESKVHFGDIRAQVRFMLPPGGRSGVLFMGRYELVLADNGGKKELTITECGGIDAASDAAAFAGRAPNFDAFRGAGQWHDLDVVFFAPSFDASGKKISNARFKRVLINDTLMHENVELPSPTRGSVLEGEAPLGPIVLRGASGAAAFGKIQVRAVNLAVDDQGWTRLFDSQSIEGWQSTGGGKWTVEDGLIVGRGPAGHLFSPRGDYADFEFRARCRISDGGNSGMYFRVAMGDGWPAGYEAQVNSTNKDPVKTGSLYNRALVRTALVPPETWFVQHVRCVDEPAGTHVTIRVNDVVVTDFVDPERRFESGHIALQQHHPESIVRYRDIEIREL